MEPGEAKTLEELAALLEQAQLADEAENVEGIPSFGPRTEWVSKLINDGHVVVSWDTTDLVERVLVRRSGGEIDPETP